MLAVIWGTLASWPGPLLFVLAIFAFGGALFALRQVMAWRKPKERPAPPSTKQGFLSPQDYVFPHISQINANSIVKGEDFLYANVHFTSALPQLDIVVTGHLIIDGAESERLPTRQVKLEVLGVYRLNSWKVSLSKRLAQDMRDDIQKKRTFSIKLWDEPNRRFNWKTEGWTTIPLVLLPWGGLQFIPGASNE